MNIGIPVRSDARATGPARARNDDHRRSALRARIADISHRSRSAHLGSALSCVEIIDTVLDAAGICASNADAPDRSRVILSKGHAALGLYVALEARGLLPPAALERYLQDGTDLWGHVTRTRIAPAIDMSTGSLGHGLGLAVGYAMGYRLLRHAQAIYCVLSDGECDEGSTWEGALFAAHHGLENLVVVIDYNKIQSLDTVANVLRLEPLADKWTSFGWTALEVDGHDARELATALAAPTGGRPKVIIAHTIKGKGIARIEDTVASHYHPALAGDAALLRPSSSPNHA
jgi:transketolase